MATYIEIANRLAQHFVTSIDKVKAANYIINEINNLVYSENQQSLTFQDKKLIIKYIGEFISGSRLFQYRDGGRILIVEQRDNSKYLELVDYMLNNLNK